MSKWIDQIFEAKAVQKGDIIWRNIADIAKYASVEELIEEVRIRKYHLVLTGSQAIIICNPGEVKLVC